MFVAEVVDESGTITCVWFNQRYLSRTIKTGKRISLYGLPERNLNGTEMKSPHWELLDESSAEASRGVYPVYPLAEGLTQKVVRNIITFLLRDIVGRLPDWLPERLRTTNGLMPIREAFWRVHWPGGLPGENTAPNWDEKFRQARRRLAYEEFLSLQISLAIRRRRNKLVKGFRHEIRFPISFVVSSKGKSLDSPSARFICSLPFELTEAQVRVIALLEKDMAEEKPMQRLLQGDVGSGKTVVFLYCMLLAVENGYQAAVMAPTEVLARQHFQTILDLTAGLGVNTVVLFGGLKSAERRSARKAIREGRADLIVGTHSLIQEKTFFKNLSLAIIDEQHKFGVGQRASLGAKGTLPDIVITSATPIPRTLALTLYGDLDWTVLDQKPPGRKPVKTYWVPEKKRRKAYSFMDEQISAGAQVYVVAPLIEESEKLPTLAAVKERYQALDEVVFPHRNVGILHGKMDAQQKEELMESFAKGEIEILVSTTVIEVGVDVPQATIMLIESAERFGLSQLHQLRGRVGRGDAESYCLLMTGQAIGDSAKRRIRAFVETEDGFKIAEADMSIRGPGELMGFRQSGLPGMRVGDLREDEALLEQAREDAFCIVSRDPELVSRNNALLGIRWKRMAGLQTLGTG